MVPVVIGPERVMGEITVVSEFVKHPNLSKDLLCALLRPSYEVIDIECFEFAIHHVQAGVGC
jgi:hypothetical protein